MQVGAIYFFYLFIYLYLYSLSIFYLLSFCLRAWVLKEKGQAAKHSSVVVYAEGVRLSANRPKPRYCTGSHASTEGEATAELFPREAEDDSREHVVAHKT